MEEMEIRKELKDFFNNCLSNSHLIEKSDEEIKETLKSTIGLQILNRRERLKEIKSLSIIEGAQKKKEYEQTIEKLEKMLELFDEEFEEFQKYKKEKERAKAFKDIVVRTKENMSKSATEELLGEIQAKAKQKHPITGIDEPTL